MITKCYKISIAAHILVEHDDGSIEEVITNPIIIYRGTEFGLNEIESIERITFQKIQNQRRSTSE